MQEPIAPTQATVSVPGGAVMRLKIGLMGGATGVMSRARNGIPEPFRAWKDTVNVRAGEAVRIAVRLRDFAGKTVFHCHIIEHEDRGMMGVLEVDGRAKWASLHPTTPS